MSKATRPSAWAALAVAAVLAGCATPPPPRPAAAQRFWVNGAHITLTPARLDEVRHDWAGDPMQLASTSRSNAADWRWILDLVALSEELGATPCRHLVFERIEPLRLEKMVTVPPTGPRVTFDPHKYNENWHIDACGAHHRWRVMDDQINPAQELTVLLLG